MINNPIPKKGSIRKFGGKIFYYLGRTIYGSTAQSISLKLYQTGIVPKVTTRSDAGYLIWGSRPVSIEVGNPEGHNVTGQVNKLSESNPGQTGSSQNVLFRNEKPVKVKKSRKVRIVSPTAHPGQSGLLAQDLGMGNPNKLTVQERGKLIGEIISTLRFNANTAKKNFDEGDTFFALAYKSDKKLMQIARACNLKFSNNPTNKEAQHYLKLYKGELGVGNPKLDPWGVPIGYREYDRFYSETEAKEKVKNLRKKGRPAIALDEGYMWAVFVKKKVDENPIKEALEYRKLYKGDLKAGHKEAAQYWKGAAAASFTGNPKPKEGKCDFCRKQTLVKKSGKYMLCRACYYSAVGKYKGENYNPIGDYECGVRYQVFTGREGRLQLKEKIFIGKTAEIAQKKREVFIDKLQETGNLYEIDSYYKNPIGEKIWTVEEIKDKVLTNDKWLERAILAIYNKQTEDEKQTEDTRYDNKVGFSGAHATIMSSFAKQLLKGYKLSPKQKAIALKVMPKYSKQLAKIANKEINPVIKPPEGFRYFDAYPTEERAKQVCKDLTFKGFSPIYKRGKRQWHVFIKGSIKNPILETLSSAVISGIGLGAGFKGLDWGLKKIRGK